ncbi:DUF636 domain-containing protein [Morchella conica CCBAS932]|uniref:DUF636 domain-containing protein n=1 Tax=Morchella conica CCBAS932 TaxID=1392247 RepID=A0A3N4KX42_9PEZI|nr:DUF636 domain-containing protein [Morchella conica CCBAS932]
MPVTLHGSCHCGAVRFSLDSSTPVPYQLCACSICRKTGGYLGSVNLGGWFNTLKISQGADVISKYKAVLNRDTPEEKLANSERSFCSKCSTMLWVWDSHWPELVHPFAPAIDTPLKEPAEMVCIKNNSKPAYVRWPEGKKQVHEDYNTLSLEEWHKENGEWVE